MLQQVLVRISHGIGVHVVDNIFVPVQCKYASKKPVVLILFLLIILLLFINFLIKLIYTVYINTGIYIYIPVPYVYTRYILL